MKSRSLGDFQTPLALAREIVNMLEPIGTKWTRVLEPTCGQGNFIHALLESGCPPEEIVGIELQNAYVEAAGALEKSTAVSRPVRLEIKQANIFDIDLNHDIHWENTGGLLVIGNPPWVTNAAQGSINSDNLPRKSNFKKLSGLDAVTGRSNFDIAEFILIKLLQDLYHQKPTIALLCKTSVARGILSYAHQTRLAISDASLRTIDAKRWFNASVDACLFTFQVGTPTADYQASFYEDLSASAKQRVIGFAGNKLVSDFTKYEQTAFIDGQSPVEWRQGVKHDAASVMELVWKDGDWFNQLNERVDVEEEFVYPLLKSSDLPSASAVNRAVIIPQTAINQDTYQLQEKAPKLWQYLSAHQSAFAARKSSIYKGKTPFSIFGIGEYSFARYKVLVSGLHKKLRFAAVGPRDGKPVLCDDTCYLLPFDSAAQVAMAAALLNHPTTIQFVTSLVFWDSKRPITKTILNRINLAALARHIPDNEICETAMKLMTQLDKRWDNATMKLGSPTDVLESLIPRSLL